MASECSICDVRVRWLRTAGERFESWEALDGDCFPCEHWREHQEASWKAVRSVRRWAREAPVRAEVVG
ncbi:MAG TPA: hypothetical protein VGW11_12805 [Solirubrobacteraceae bacterium]|nr:hypothetical protein [Solirubrobacteraceae bacterium]